MLKYLLIAVLTIVQFNASALQLQSHYWGYDNTVRHNSFNMITLVFHNDSPDVYDDYIILSPNDIMGGASSAIQRRIFLNPNQKKTLQLGVFIEANSSQDWKVTWNGGGVRLPTAAIGYGSQVYITSQTFVRKLPKGLKLFPASYFPATVSLTSDLETVALNQNPDWTPLQREAFMDWLKKGGTLYILQNQNGDHPQFTSLMQSLNFDGTSKSIGSGTVIRSNSSLSTFEPPITEKLDVFNYSPSYENDTIIQALRTLVKTDHNWGLIYFLIFIYLAFIGPLNYLVGRRTRDWKMPNLFFLLTVIGFSILFSIIGRRGYGEQTQLNSFSFADHIEGENYDVKQWTDIFVTSGDLYNLSHAGSLNLYYAPSENTNLKTVADMDKNNFSADIPLFSSRGMIHRAKLKGPEFNAQLKRTAGDKLSVDMKSDQEIKKVWFVYDGNIWETSQSGQEYTAYDKVDPSEYDYYDSVRYGDYDVDAYETVELNFLSFFSSKISPYQNRNLKTDLNSEMVQVLIMAKSPKSFHYSEGNIEGSESGWTFYRLKLKKKAE